MFMKFVEAILPFLLWGVYTTWTTTKILLSKMLSKILTWWFFTTSTTSQSISIEPHGSNSGFPDTYNHRHARMLLQYIALSCLRLIWHCLVLMLFEERYDWKRWRPYTCATLARQCLWEQGAKLTCVKLIGHGRSWAGHQINGGPIQDPIINDSKWLALAKNLQCPRSSAVTWLIRACVSAKETALLLSWAGWKRECILILPTLSLQCIILMPSLDTW